MGASAGFLGDIIITSTPSLTLPANLAVPDSGDHTTFQLASSSTYRIWDRSSTLTVQTSPDGTSGWTTVVPKSITYLGGKVTFNSAVTGATPSCRVTVGKYFAWSSMGNTTEWSAALAVKTVESTTHKGVGGSPWADSIPTILSGKFSLKKWWVNDLATTNNLTNRTLLVLSLLTPLGNRYDAYGYFDTDTIKLAVAGLVEEDINFTSDSIVLYN